MGIRGMVHETERRKSTWSAAAGYAMVICAVVLGLYLYWFGVADRYAVFLYEHLGATPFDGVTRGRYAMAGFVAAAIVALGYLPVNWWLARVSWGWTKPYIPPQWWQVWSLSALPVAVGIVLITMNVNWPTLPLGAALLSAMAALVGLALAVAPGRMVAQSPVNLAWCAWIGLGSVPLVIGVRTIELPSRGILNAQVAAMVVAVSIAVGLVWTALWLQVYVRRAHTPMSWRALLLASLTWSYLVLPLLHYWVATPWEFRYVPAASNYFADHLTVQALTYGLVLLVTGVAYLPLRRAQRMIPTRPSTDGAR